MRASANIESGETPHARERRSVLACVLAAVAVAMLSLAFAGPAGARGGVDDSTSLSGTAEWTDQTTTIHGTFSGRLGAGTYSGNLTQTWIDTTGWCGPTCFTVAGEITLSSKRGDFTAVVEPGSLMRESSIASNTYRGFVLELAVVDGTRSYRRARGELLLSYDSTWWHSSWGGVIVNEVEDHGSLTGNPRK